MVLAGTVLVALLVFFLPGFAVSWAAGLKVPVAAAAALPVTFGVVGFSAWMWGAVDAPFGWFTFGITLALALGVALGVRWLFNRRAREDKNTSRWRGSLSDPYWVLPAAGVVVGAWMLIYDKMTWLVSMPLGVNNIVQGWDSQWHANAVRFIMTEHVASATRMGELHNIESHAPMLYPSAFHATTALFAQAAGYDPIPAVNIASIVFPGVALPVTMACLVFAILRSRGVTAQIGAALAAVSIYVAPPLWVADSVGIWPYLSAVSVVGIVIWLFCTVPAHPVRAFPAALAFLGILEVHPAVATYVVLAVALFWVTSLLIKPARGRLRDLLWLAVASGVGGVLFLPQALFASAQAEEVSSWRTPEDAGVTDPWKVVLTLTTRHVDSFFPGFDPAIVLWLAGFGALVALLWRGQVWAVIFYVVSAAATVCALVPIGGWFGDILATIGGFHYNTAHRLVQPVAMVTFASASIGVAAMIRLLTLAPLAARRGKAGWTRASTSVSAIVAVLAGAGVSVWAETTARAGAEAAFSEPRSGDRMVNENDLRAFDWLAAQPVAWEGYTFGEPADGYSWAYAYNGLPTISRHYMSAMGGRGSATDTAYWHSDYLGNGRRGDADAQNVTDTALKDLNVKFYLLSPGTIWEFQYERYGQLKGLWTSPGVTPVYRKGTTVIFAVNSQFTDTELRALRRSAREAGSDDIPVLTPAARTNAAGAE
ncbi:hypothetical protein CAPI_01555 [Corynebacterium capitovis DSM 44611]|uniref:DUF6541 family protein n=1 Tax=Corynebacterium capitovis TaxID=131081 RepID=UPI000365BD51|nr:DUF6541 family protein [Corynebacterium capitovis]WKD56885.1 hypothetical protein CAPI_01555 [Corynebacterium capitovis DSM 44611]